MHLYIGIILYIKYLTQIAFVFVNRKYSEYGLPDDSIHVKLHGCGGDFTLLTWPLYFL